MRGVGGKLPHALLGVPAVIDRRRDARNGIVEGCGQRGDLVAAGHDEAALRVIAVGERTQRVAHLVDRPQRLLREEPPDEPREKIAANAIVSTIRQ